jgi:hypothetical protein
MRSSPKVPILVRVTRGRNADVVTNPQEPHGQYMDTPVVVQCCKVSMSVMESRSSISWAEHKGSVCGEIMRGASHMAPINM